VMAIGARVELQSAGDEPVRETTVIAR
jgi:hypothetical protein